MTDDRTSGHPDVRQTRGLTAQPELACGRSVDAVLDQVAEGHGDILDAHQQQCPHCRAALGEFTDLWAPVLQAAAEPVRAPSELRMAVRRRIDQLVDDVWYTLQLTDGGAVRIAARVVAAVARDTARRVPGVRVALGRSTHGRISQLVAKATRMHHHPRAAVGVLGRTAVVDLALAVTYGDRVDEVAREVQRRVVGELRDVVRLNSVTVNVTVDDVIA